MWTKKKGQKEEEEEVGKGKTLRGSTGKLYVNSFLTCISLNTSY